MATRAIRNSQIEAFMEILRPIQARLKARHGSNCVDEWREERLSRGNWDLL